MKFIMWRQFLLPIYLIACCLILPVHSWLNKVTFAKVQKPRRLVLALDGVPYKTIAELRAEGRFRYFKEPARMISTFPSLTNPAMIEILHAEDSQGYEDHYYDRERNRLIGSVQDRLRGDKFIQHTFRETFDYHAPALKGALGYVAAPVGAMAVAQLDLSSFRESFKRSNSPVFIGYIGETDSLAHLGGEGRLKAFLRSLDRAVEELISENDGRLEVEMFSDHGNDYGDFQEVKLNDAIEKAGYVAEKSINNSRSVVLPKHGLVGSSMLFTMPENRKALAETCAAVKGVDFAVYPVNLDAIELISRRGRAMITRDGDRFGYENRGGDPLSLDEIIESMRSNGLIDKDGLASSEDWWRMTRDHRYVDPLRRLFDGFESYVRNRADVIVSYEDGYLLGSPVLSVFVTMRATHGNLLRGETEGFAMSTRQNLAGAVRGYELQRLFALDQRSKAEVYFSGTGHCRLGPALAMMAIPEEEERIRNKRK